MLSTNNVSLCRCSTCKGYLNPYVTYSASSQNWLCSLCGSLNYLDRPWSGADTLQTLSYTYEVPAGPEFVPKPPPTPIYAFLFDLSPGESNQHFIAAACEVLKNFAEDGTFPQSECRVAVLSYSSAVQVFCLKNSLQQPSMISIPNDFDELPLPLDEIVCDFEEGKANFISLMESLPKVIDASKQPATHCLDLALKQILHIFKCAGGKLLVFRGSHHIEQKKQEDKVMPKMNRLLGVMDISYRVVGFELAGMKVVTCDLFVASNDYEVVLLAS
eukprot:TRINITY_DN13506_c0_g1_i8.p1 TRINITY_DN13506_c0_g1~~TRINITY_DN13506_c0_g1_i8.p1  ORF type:complete len:273 (+),score=63.71 TRINITY_DN13506_c0_g1_i8:292-1110(+)